jgi:hypothetical protein
MTTTTIRQRNINIGADYYETAQTCSPTCLLRSLSFLRGPSTSEKRYVNVFRNYLIFKFGARTTQNIPSSMGQRAP